MTVTTTPPQTHEAEELESLTDALAQTIELLDPQHLFDAYAAATARYYRRRADAFDAARPTLDGYHGRATHEEIAARWDRLTTIAQACRNRALYAEMYGPTDAELALFHSVAAAVVATA